VILVLILIIIKSVLSVFVVSPSIFSDEMLYAQQSLSILSGNLLLQDGLRSYQPFYSLLISPANLIANPHITYFLMKLINAILSSLIVLPAYLIVKEFLNKKRSLIIATIIAILCLHFIICTDLSNMKVIMTIFYVEFFLA